MCSSISGISLLFHQFISQAKNYSFFPFVKIALAILGPLDFHRNFRLSLSISTKNSITMLIGIALNLSMNLDRIDILIIVTLPTHEHSIYFHLSRYLKFSSSNILCFLVYLSFTTFAHLPLSISYF